MITIAPTVARSVIGKCVLKYSALERDDGGCSPPSLSESNRPLLLNQASVCRQSSDSSYCRNRECRNLERKGHGKGNGGLVLLRLLGMRQFPYFFESISTKTGS